MNLRNHDDSEKIANDTKPLNIKNSHNFIHLKFNLKQVIRFNSKGVNGKCLYLKIHLYQIRGEFRQQFMKTIFASIYIQIILYYHDDTITLLPL